MKAWIALSTALLAAGVCRAADGRDAYTKHCALCHQVEGKGTAGQFPRLAGRIGAIAAAPEGAELLAEITLWGMSGRITFEGKPLVGVMPGFARLSDDEIAGILTYLADLPGSARPVAAFAPETVKAVRAAGPRSASAVNARRQKLHAAGVVK